MTNMQDFCKELVEEQNRLLKKFDPAHGVYCNGILPHHARPYVAVGSLEITVNFAADKDEGKSVLRKRIIDAVTNQMNFVLDNIEQE